MKQSEVIKEIKNGLYEKNVSFLFGSGASMPFFKTLGNLENILTRLRKDETKYDSLIKLLYVDYFKKSIEGNIQILDDKNSCNNVLTQYIRFIKCLSAIMSYRNDRISPKRANIFTTNYDVFLERAIDIVQSENPSLVLNDGAQGYFNRYLSLENFHKTVSRNGVFDNYHKELLSLNLIKCHGSVTWSLSKEFEDRIKIKNSLDVVKNISDSVDRIKLSEVEQESLKRYLNQEGQETIGDDDLLKIANKYDGEDLDNFSSTYKKLLLINPEKSKFNHTVFEEHYYSMLRLLSYELERDETMLIVFGFSFADEHIRNLIKRSIHNPGLKIYIFSYDMVAARNIRQLLPN